MFASSYSPFKPSPPLYAAHALHTDYFRYGKLDPAAGYTLSLRGDTFSSRNRSYQTQEVAVCDLEERRSAK